MRCLKLGKSGCISERFIQLGKHVKIAINISITGAFGWILSTVISWISWDRQDFKGPDSVRPLGVMEKSRQDLRKEIWQDVLASLNASFEEWLNVLMTLSLWWSLRVCLNDIVCVLWDVLLLLSESIVEIIVFIGSIFERFIQLGKHVKIAININITGAFGWILSTVISYRHQGVFHLK